MACAHVKDEFCAPAKPIPLGERVQSFARACVHVGSVIDRQRDAQDAIALPFIGFCPLWAVCAETGFAYSATLSTFCRHQKLWVS
jgi:hypothetical protein